MVRAAVLGLVSIGVLSGCGGGGGNAALPDATPSPSPDAASGAHAPIPIVDFLGGPILAAPKVVTVTYGADGDPNADPNRAFVETFDDTILATPWWDTVSAEYCDQGTPPRCVGRGASGGHVHLTDVPAAALTDSPTGGSLRDLLQGYLTSGTFPAPDQNTLYVIYFPATTMITIDGFAASCTYFGAYHASFEATLPGTAGTVTIPYVIVPNCSDLNDTLTLFVSHELIETATDPVDPDPALGGTAFSMTADTVWPVFGFGTEVGDLCIWPNGTDTSYLEGSYRVQRSWSNAAAAASHDPCVPAGTAPYFNVAPEMDKVSVAVGQSTTLDLVAFADGSMPDWNVAVTDVSAGFGGTTNAGTFTLSKATAHDGTRFQLTVTLTQAAKPNPVYLMIDSTSGGTVHRSPVEITSP